MLKGRLNGARKLLWIQHHVIMPKSRGGQQTPKGGEKQDKSQEKKIQEKHLFL